jgi:threonine aldolase
MNFESDNVYGVHPRILAALHEANGGTASSYGGDTLTRRAEEKLSEAFGREVRAFPVTTGTAANGLSLSAIAPAHGAVFCHAEAHISCDECSAPEFFTGGAKLIALPGPAGKIGPAAIEKALKGFIRGEHDPKPKAVSLANATELGTVYRPEEVAAIAATAWARDMKLHMDGSRFANAVAGIGCTPADLTWKAGVDVLSFGGTKNGAMLLDAVIFFDPDLADDFDRRRMRAGQLVSKSRFLAAQMLAYLEGALWLDCARTANALAQRLAAGLRRVAGVRIPHPVEANAVFAVMPRALSDRLLAEGVKFHAWMPDSLGDAIADDEVFVRLVASFATPAADVDRFLALAARKD